jgi:isopenicillin N synthase-like dioxygenase
VTSSETFPPVVDLESPYAPAEIDEACRTVGFFQIVNHGIPSELLDAVFEVADKFFGLDLADKLAWLSPVPEVERGYAAKGTEGLAYSLGLDQPPDLFEAFTVGLDSLPDEPAFHTGEHNFFAPNIWPDEPKELRPVLLSYREYASRLVDRINSLMALALGLEADFFEPFTDASVDTLRVNFFEGRPGDSALPGQYGIGPHTDYGICTVLYADQEPGLQAYTKEEEWRFVVPIPGALLVNVGDLLARWTNDRWRSTLHRVVPVLTTDDTIRRRRSVPFFREGNYDAIVTCLPTCTDAEHPPLYPPIKGGEHVQAKALLGRLLEATGAGESTVGDRTKALTS